MPKILRFRVLENPVDLRADQAAEKRPQPALRRRVDPEQRRPADNWCRHSTSDSRGSRRALDGRRFAAELDVADDPMRAMREVFSAGAGIGAAVNGLFGAALVVIGIAVSRRVRWAHSALLISCWSSIAVLAVLAKPTLAPFFAMAGGNATAGLGMLVASAVLLVAQIVAVLWFLRFWRRPEVRAGFR